MPRQSRYNDETETWDGPSKTMLKLASQDVQELGAELFKLNAAQLDDIVKDERLRAALREHGRMPTREAKRRHMHFIGKLLRNGDSEPALRQALANIRAGEARLLAEAEAWRERLLTEDAALTEWIKAHPHIEVQPLRALVRNARRELGLSGSASGASANEQGDDPTGAIARGKSRAFRDLFQALRIALKTTTRPTTPTPDPEAE